MTVWNFRCALLLCLAVLTGQCALVLAQVATEDDDAPKFDVRKLPYEDKYKHGLYSTIVSVISTYAPEIKEQKAIRLKVKDYRKEIDAKIILQENPAPLVVVLVGIDGREATGMGRLFPYWLSKHTGFHVLSFDSTFRPNFAKNSRFGVTGNLLAEAEQIGKLIQAFLETKEAKDKVTKIGCVGYSLGATQAMLLAKLAKDKKLPFTLSGAVALSPPVRLQTTAKILDEFYSKDRWKYTMIDMAKEFMNHDPVEAGTKIPFEDDFMRAGIGYIIREEFTKIVEQNDSIFRLKHIKDELEDPTVNRVNEARAWGFERFMERMAFPYWQKAGAVKTVDELWAMGDMSQIMNGLPAFAHAIVALDDPFSNPEEIRALQNQIPAQNLTVLPHGGHIGYIASPWSYYQVAGMFSRE